MHMEIVITNAERAAGRYKRRCWWANYEDMRQEAIVAQLETIDRGTYDPSFGRPLAAYLWTVAMYAVQRLVHKASAPVSTSHRTRNLVGLYRAPTEMQGEDGSSYQNPALNDAHTSSEEKATAQDRANRVRARVVELVGEQAAEFAFSVMTHEWRPSEVADEHGVNVKIVYAAQRRIANTLIEDRRLYDLWKESNG